MVDPTTHVAQGARGGRQLEDRCRAPTGALTRGVYRARRAERVLAKARASRVEGAKGVGDARHPPARRPTSH
ncbi:hypothetical protein C8Q78DRAFT_1051438 [Trametes maxima]|nr:hypothetical protein C8Q78DRAFT_1051438 [Trametes maxima]